MNYSKIIEENKRRVASSKTEYNPITDKGCCHDRVAITISDMPLPEQWIPKTMLEEIPLVKLLVESGSIKSFIENELKIVYTNESYDEIWKAYIKIRIRYDFEFWAIMYVLIKPKDGGDNIPFFLYRPQRKLLRVMESMRIANTPIRIILLKARQWGGSTLVQIYMAWIQLVHKSNWNSTICAHVKTSSQNIHGMYARFIEKYPPWLLDSKEQIKFRPYMRSQSASIINETQCKVIIGSSQAPESVRGEDASMAHCSEVAFYEKTENNTPEQLIRSVCGGISTAPYTIIVYESTANGTGDYFHTEWLRANKPEDDPEKSDKTPVFVAWFEIEIYSSHVENYKKLIDSFTDYDWWLWSKGATLENISWYKNKRKEYRDHSDMKAEYPSDDVEAFKHSGETVFDPYKVAELQKGCMKPEYIGELSGDSQKGKEAFKNIRFNSDVIGRLKIWEMPDNTPISNRYITIVDVGGRGSKADYSVITVIDRYWLMYAGKVAIVAQWRGHIDHDLLAWKAAQIATFYNKCLLVIESNTYETEKTDGEHTEYILDQISAAYDNLYSRVSSDKIKEGVPAKWGFHTNVSTKTLIVDSMVESVRELDYIERDLDACHELNVYEKKKNGAFGARDGHHDDIAMTRFIGIYVSKQLPVPKKIKTEIKKRKTTIISEASI